MSLCATTSVRCMYTHASVVAANNNLQTQLPTSVSSPHPKQMTANENTHRPSANSRPQKQGPWTWINNSNTKGSLLPVRLSPSLKSNLCRVQPSQWDARICVYFSAHISILGHVRLISPKPSAPGSQHHLAAFSLKPPIPGYQNWNETPTNWE